MSDKCICGHDHIWQDGQRYQECVEEFCECEEFRDNSHAAVSVWERERSA